MIWVHKSDLHHSRKISQSEYGTCWKHPGSKCAWSHFFFSDSCFLVLFKLRQLNDVDDVILQRLTVRFTELDMENIGMLKIGLHIPSAQQVQVLLKIAKSTGRETHLWSIWKEMRPEFVKSDLTERGAEKPPSFSLSDLVEDETQTKSPLKPIRLIACHKFEWSRRLWREAMQNTALLGWYIFVACKSLLKLLNFIFITLTFRLNCLFPAFRLESTWVWAFSCLRTRVGQRQLDSTFSLSQFQRSESAMLHR